jgi:hypothetical protein
MSNDGVFRKRETAVIPTNDEEAFLQRDDSASNGPISPPQLRDNEPPAPVSGELLPPDRDRFGRFIRGVKPGPGRPKHIVQTMRDETADGRDLIKLLAEGALDGRMTRRDGTFVTLTSKEMRACAVELLDRGLAPRSQVAITVDGDKLEEQLFLERLSFEECAILADLETLARTQADLGSPAFSSRYMRLRRLEFTPELRARIAAALPRNERVLAGDGVYFADELSVACRDVDELLPNKKESL